MQRTERGAGNVWFNGIERHVDDLRLGSYEGETGLAREEAYRKAFDLLTPVASRVLASINTTLLDSKGDLSVVLPVSDGIGGLIGSWALTWPLLLEATNRKSGGRLRPVTISAVFPMGFTHPHLVAGGPVDPRSDSLIAWPMQVTTADDAAAIEPLMWAIATAELHDRIYQSSWRVIPGG